jgi:DNA-directed RNA polymerase subunit N (RpoN/RPB10)
MKPKMKQQQLRDRVLTVHCHRRLLSNETVMVGFGINSHCCRNTVVDDDDRYDINEKTSN